MQHFLNFIISKINPIKNQLKNKSVLVTGASGFIGKWIILTLSELNKNKNQNIKIYFLTRNKKKFLNENQEFKKLPGVKYIEKDILKVNFKNIHFDFIFHLAGDLNKSNQNQIKYFDELTRGSFNIFNYSLINKNVKILFLSSGAVYGDFSKKKKCIETSPIIYEDRLENTYKIGKLYAENYLGILHKKKQAKVKIARLFSLVGPYQKKGRGFALIDFIDAAMKNETINVQSKFRVYRSYIFIADLIVWLFIILIKGKSGSIYNVGSNTEIAIDGLANKVVSLLNSKSKVRVSSLINKSNKMNYYVPDISLAQKELNLDIWTSLDDSILFTNDFLRTHE